MNTMPKWVQMFSKDTQHSFSDKGDDRKRGETTAGTTSGSFAPEEGGGEEKKLDDYIKGKDLREFRNGAFEYLQDHYKDKIITDSSGDKVSFSRKGNDKIANSIPYEKKEALERLDEIITTGKRVNEKLKDGSIRKDYSCFEVYEKILNINGKDVLCRLHAGHLIKDDGILRAYYIDEQRKLNEQGIIKHEQAHPEHLLPLIDNLPQTLEVVNIEFEDLSSNFHDSAASRGLKFTDKLCLCGGVKNLISVRDGKLQYRGYELGVPDNNVYNVYRRPETIKALENAMSGLPITNGHIDIEQPVPKECKKGEVLTSELVPLADENKQSTVGIKNTVRLEAELMAEVSAGKRQLSLGYYADTRPYKDGYEQYAIRPHHLAVVDCGRCGVSCSFMDKSNKTIKETKTIKKSFRDLGEGGEMPVATLERIAEIAVLLPKAVGKVPLEKLNEVMPLLEELISLAGDIEPDITPTQPEDVAGDGSNSDTSQEGAAKDNPGDNGTPPEDEKKKFGDSTKFTDAVNKAVSNHLSVVEKARGFLPESYGFASKTPNQIMRDAIATQSKAKFTDAELPTAFKMLQKSNKYQNFADAASNDPFAKLAEKEI
ncbi:MAG: DUF2213 domain-containing protein [Deferribacteraceae bacterium]|jgi:hypothetical protein|nr:DUF2213 domain-containing protein [Deferribacteraceae bacterium]